jgi:hypothetical protein
VAAPTSTLPNDSLQSLVGSWWTEDADKPKLCRGRLIWAFVPYVDQEPRTLTLEGRVSPDDHHHGVFKIDPLRMSQQRTAPKVPIAALPLNDDEILTIYRAKRRPALVLGGESTPAVDKALTQGMSKWQTAPTVVVAPYYGIPQSSTRGGFNQQFIDRVRLAEYPEYVWDSLPIVSKARESILMLNQVQPIGRHYNSHELTKFRLTDDALDCIDDWVEWLLTATLDSESVLTMFRQGAGAL